MKVKLVSGMLAASLFASATCAQSLIRSEKDLERDKSSKGQQVVQLAEITDGMNVLDLLGGGGYYSELLSVAVGKTGTVYLHNNNAYLPYVGEQLAIRLGGNRLPNVARFNRELDNLALTSGKFDAVFFVLGYHDIYHQAEGWKVDRKSLHTQLRSIIKKGGKLVIVDHSAKAGSGTSASQDLHRIEKQYVINELQALGFSIILDSQLLANPDDDRTLSPFDPNIRRKTDRFVLVFKHEG